MADPKGFLTTGREVAKTRPVDERVKDWNEVYVPGSLLPIISKQAGRCMDCGIPFCHNGCPLGNLIPEWNDYAYREDWTAAVRAAARHEQLPGVHRAAVPRPVRVGVRARHQPARRHHQERRGLHHRQGVGQRRRHPAAARAPVRQDRRGHRLGPGGPGRRPAADPGRPHGRRVRARGPHRRSAALRHPRVQDGEAAHQPPHRADARGGHQVPYRRGDRPRHRRRRAAQAVRRGGHRRRCHHLPRPAGPGPRAERHPPGDGVPAAGQQGAGGRLTVAPRSPPRASTSSSSAAATPAPTASAPPTARARPPSPSWRSCPGRARSGTPNQPWPTFPMLYKVTSAHEEGGERVYSVSTTHFEGDEDGNVQCAAPGRGRVQGRQAGPRSRAPSGRSPPQLVTLAMGFTGTDQ